MARDFRNTVGTSDTAEYRDALAHGRAAGRGAQLNPGNRYETVRLHVLGDHLDLLLAEDETDAAGRQVRTQVYRDRTRTIINPVNSPDLSFNWTINPYRGCEHGCVYCYARPDHERLGFSSGLDFETKILAKPDAPALLRKELDRPSWRGESIVMSGDTDCYQPIEAKLRITRDCLAVMAECRQPVSIITKNRLVLRDLDYLAQLMFARAVRVAVSVTTLDHQLAAAMEPRASSPRDRLHAIRELAAAGVPVTAMVAPIIPGLNDREVPRILEAVADAGATNAGYVLLRLPHQNKALFENWLHEHFPQRAEHVLSLVRQTRGGRLYDASFTTRQRGEGPIAAQIGSMFRVFQKRYHLDRKAPPVDRSMFRRPGGDGQMRLFD